MDAIAEGEYQWSPSAGEEPILVDGRALNPGDTMRLGVGMHRLAVSEGTSGILHWAVGDPVPGRGMPFFDFVVVAELTGKVY